jgi:SDR family mycofactocin-dependent oxidoreductase
VGRVEGKVALITGAARGQGREHALALAREGAAIVAVDIDTTIDSIEYPLATEDELNETVRLVEELGGRIVARNADVRSDRELAAAVDAGLAEFEKIDVVCANAGVCNFASTWEMTDEQWESVIDVNLTGVWRTLKATVPQMIENGEGGSVIITSSALAHQAVPGMASYIASKNGLVGLARTLAREVGEHSIRVNTVHPATVRTPIFENDAVAHALSPDRDFNTPAERLEVLDEVMAGAMLLPISALESVDMSNAILYLASEESRYVTGTEFRVDGGLPNS